MAIRGFIISRVAGQLKCRYGQSPREGCLSVDQLERDDLARRRSPWQ